MRLHRISDVARAAVAPNSERPATAMMHDSADVRLVVFRLEPGQAVPPHTSTSSVTLVIGAGSGFVSDAVGEHAVQAGEVVSYEPRELHGMRAATEQMVILAAIAPRPGSR